MKISIGTEPFEGWKVVEEIDEGSFGVVYRAEKDGYSTAIKHILIPNENERKRVKKSNSVSMTEYYRPKANKLKEEIQIMKAYSEVDGIVKYEDHKIREMDGDGWEILIRMEYLTPLNTYIEKNGFTLAQVLKLGKELAEALAECNIIHRDIKESNIFLTKNGKRFKLGDFGVSKHLGDIKSASTYAGTLGYIAPEIMRQERYDQRADIYSIGIVLYLLLNERLMPFEMEDSNSADCEKAYDELMTGKRPLNNPKYGNQEIFSIVQKACGFRPEDRFKTHAELADALNKAINTADKSLLDTFVLMPQAGKRKKVAMTPPPTMAEDSGKTVSADNEQEREAYGKASPKIENNQSTGCKKVGMNKKINWLFAAAGIILALVIIYAINTVMNKKDDIESIQTTVAVEAVTSPVPTETAEKAAAEKVAAEKAINITGVWKTANGSMWYLNQEGNNITGYVENFKDASKIKQPIKGSINGVNVQIRILFNNITLLRTIYEIPSMPEDILNHNPSCDYDLVLDAKKNEMEGIWRQFYAEWQVGVITKYYNASDTANPATKNKVTIKKQ